jgi:predicted AAA+ superfamily ATPase
MRTVLERLIDEVQRVEGWDRFVRRVLDTENLRLWLTGSSSKLLSSEIATSLRGRSLTTEVFPFSFREFLRFHH